MSEENQSIVLEVQNVKHIMTTTKPGETKEDNDE